MAKDLFSKQSSGYAKYRPTYPFELYQFIFNHCNAFDHAWDCATGNGQVAQALKDQFTHVAATDISKEQLSRAVLSPNITYQISASEHTAFDNESFDLITVGQALHWFEINTFFQEVDRVLKPSGIMAFWGYGFFQIDGVIDHEIESFKNQLVPYWDEKRQLVDTRYESIHSPFKEIALPSLFITRKMTLMDLCNYLRTWSAVQHFKDIHAFDPVDELQNRLNNIWPASLLKTVEHPLFGSICLK